eukprot:TRINITY_DN1295_c0_g1_i1.p1 TRINITY_DN1295_c0_g1~~TRINITY_DN1295_c0_g1_i1.p1  ORF type:complete len:147 (-),score=20.01 TRINITY_DN1295_c0_g1_i1:83-523(-)
MSSNANGRLTLDARFKQLAVRNRNTGGFVPTFKQRSGPRRRPALANRSRNNTYNPVQRGPNTAIQKRRPNNGRMIGNRVNAATGGRRRRFNPKNRSKDDLDKDLVGYMHKNPTYVKNALNDDLKDYMASREVSKKNDANNNNKMTE